jgi:photosystem II stability/assembly factor-like uncharacterized protein
MKTTRSRLARVLAAAALVTALAAHGTSFDAPQVLAQADVNQIVPAAAYKDLKWRQVGAARGGRVTGFAGHRQQPHTFYAGATGGGVWKTDDAGITWYPIGDREITTGSIGSIEVAPSNANHVWVGTGSAAIRSNVIIGRGVFKSTDAGKSFQFAGLRDVGQIGTIRVHPTNPDIVWAAASGSPFGPSEDRGVFKTTDGGKTWRKTLYVDTEHGARDIEVDWQNPDVLYAATYRGFRKGWDIISGGPADKGGIWKSVDGGETWKKVSAGLPGKLIGKIDLDIARSNPKVLFAMIEAPAAEGGLYRSGDAGESWTLVNNSQTLRARPFYFNYVNVNPKDENTVFVSELRFHKSTDGGKTFRAISTPHADNHGQRRRRQRHPERRAELVVDPEPAACRVLHGGRGRPVSVSPLRAAAGQHDAHRSKRAARVVGDGSPGAVLGAGLGMRNGRHLAAARRQRGVGRVQR